MFIYLLVASSIALAVEGLSYSGQPSNNNHNAYAATTQNQSRSNSTAANVRNLDTIMAQLEYSNKPSDIATLAYIWGFSPVIMERQFHFLTSPNTPPGIGIAPANTLSCARQLLNASFTTVTSPNQDTLYCQVQFDLSKEPVVVVVPPIKDRYSSFEFLDAFTNDYAYVGERATGTTGGTYLIAGPEWNGTIPTGMTKIWTPTNLAWLLNRILVKGPSDLSNVNAIQDKIIVKPLSAFQKNPTNATFTSPLSKLQASQANASKKAPIGPQPGLVASTGIKIYDEIGAAMIGNPLNPPDPVLVSKLASIGIGPGKVPSVDANATTKAALQIGITEGQKLINQKVANLGQNLYGWSADTQNGVYGTDYLLRAAVTQAGLGANIAQEFFSPGTAKDNQGNPLSGNNNYTIHFNPGKLPPVNGYWSITMLNNKSLFVPNPINRYAIGVPTTPGLKNNTDGSLNIYISSKNPGPQNQSNWLPAPQGAPFNLVFRLAIAQPQILNGTWPFPTIQRTG